MTDIGYEVFLDAVHLKQASIAGLGFSPGRDRFLVELAVFQRQRQLLGQRDQ